MRIAIEPKPVTFEACHSLPKFCPSAHGHSYRVSVKIAGPVDHGIVADFQVVRRIVKAVVAKLDHRMLNDVIENPTAERVAVWIWNRIEDKIRRSHPECLLVGLRLVEGEHAVEVTP